MSNAHAYLLASLIVSETDSVAINTIFDAIPIADMPAEYRELYATLRHVWATYHVIEPIAVHEQIKLMTDKDDETQAKHLRQFNELWGLVIANSLWQHYLRMVLTDIKVAKVNTLGRTLSVPDPKLVDDVLAETQQQINEIMSKYQIEKRRNLPDICNDYLQYVEQVATHGAPDTIKTGYGWEQFIRGFRAGDYILLAARPKMGKSAVANAIIVRALRQDKRIMLVNNEMDEMAVMHRLIANVGRIDCEALREPEHMTEAQLSAMMKATDHIRNSKLHLYCMRHKTPRDIENEALRLKEQGTPIDMLVVDYLQLFQASDHDRRKSRYDEVSYLSWEMKMLANDLKIPVLVLSQLNRQLEQRTNKRPVPADLRDSGSLEQDATAVMFLYRDEVYNPESDDAGIGEINVSINRNGKSGVTYYAIDFDHMDVLDAEREAQ